MKNYNVIVDVMCGSGTLLIEAARSLKKDFSFQKSKKYMFENWLTFQPEAFEKAKASLDESPQSANKLSQTHFYGFDVDPRAIAAAQANAQRAGVAENIRFQQISILDLQNQANSWPPSERGLVVTNPPYGQRMEKGQGHEELYKSLGTLFKREFIGWDCWVLSGNRELTQHIGLKASQRHPVYNGSIECRWINYKIY